jgi:hypothetical protein
MPLAVGAVWRGHQRSGLQSYEVEVRIAGVDESTGDVCGECPASFRSELVRMLCSATYAYA